MELPHNFTLGLGPLLVGTTLLIMTSVSLFTAFRSYRRLSHIPGPWSAAFSKWWMIRATANGEMPFKLAEACRQYGSLTRIGPNDLVTDDAELLRYINGLRSPFTRSDWYNATAFSHKTNHAFCERDDALHNERRNKLIPGYSGRDNDHLEVQIDDRIADFCALIDRKYTSSSSEFRPVDLARICSYFTLEVIYTLAFGSTMGFLANDADVHGYLSNQKAMLPVFEWLSTLPALEKLLRISWISERIMPKKTDKTGVGLLLKFAEGAVAERHATKRRDILSSFLDHGLTDEQAEQEAVLQIIAGSDTTATTIRMIIFYLITNPRAYYKLVHEIDTAGQEGTLSFPVIQDIEAKQMGYLEACIKEGLRMWPPVVGLMSKQVPPGGAKLLGKFLPGGTCIGYSAWGLQRKKETFGEDADIFRPDRWLEETDERRLAEMSRTVDLVFGWGKNACLGKAIAQIEMRKTISELLRRYDISIVNPEHPFNSVNRNGLFIQDSMFVRFERRNEAMRQ
jgi:cytochrome P450